MQASVSVELRAVAKVFPGPVRVFDDFSLKIEPGEFVTLLGPSGCGKSTLLRLIAGLDAPTRGTFHISDPAAPVACVFQDAHLLPWRNVLANAELPLELQGVPFTERQKLAREALHALGLDEALTRFPAQLSGGMKMRVSLARGLVTRPRLFLLDEPFAALDEITRLKMCEILRKLWRSSGMTVVFVTHSISEAAYLSERVIVISRRPGRILAERRIGLPAEREPSIRGTPEFAHEVKILLQNFDTGEAE